MPRSQTQTLGVKDFHNLSKNGSGAISCMRTCITTDSVDVDVETNPNVTRERTLRRSTNQPTVWEG